MNDTFTKAEIKDLDAVFGPQGLDHGPCLTDPGPLTVERPIARLCAETAPRLVTHTARQQIDAAMVRFDIVLEYIDKMLYEHPDLEPREELERVRMLAKMALDHGNTGQSKL